LRSWHRSLTSSLLGVLGVVGALGVLGPLGPLEPSAGALLKAASAASAAPQGASGSFSESTEVTVVQVPVQVVRAGEPVRGLTAADFEVYDGKNRQKVTGFEVLDLAARQGPAVASIPPVLRRHFLLLFDLSFSEPKSLLKARQMMRDALPSLHPSDLVAVATYSSADGPRLVVGFTSDRRQVLKAIDHLGLTQLVDRNPDPLKLMAGREEASGGHSMSAVEGGDAGSRARAASMMGRGAGAAQQAANESEMIDILETQARTADSADRQQQQAVIGAFARSFTDLARLMAGIHGRKEVIYFSEGFDTSLVQGVESMEQREKMADLATHGEAYLTDSNTRYGDTRGGNGLERMLEELRRSDCVIQAVDIGGLRAQGDAGLVRRSGEGSLFAMAHDTGGEMYRNFNDLGAAMGQLLHKTSLTYVLTFQPDGVRPDGSYHQLRVALRNVPAAKGAQLSYRPGYYAPRPYRQQSAGERQQAAAEAVVGGGDSGVLRTAVLAVPLRSPGAGGNAYVPVVIETDGASLLNGNPGETLALEVYAYAIDSSGAIQDFFGQALRFELDKVIPLLDRAGLKFFGHLDLPPGEYNVRVLVRNAANGDYGLRNQPLVVPGFDHPAPVLLPPFFPERPERWLMVHQTQRGGQQEAPYPFVVRQKIYVPALRPVLAPDQQVALALMGYNLPAGDLKATARVLSVQGVDLGVGDFTIDGREPPDAEGTERLTATFRPSRGLEPGEYQLVIQLTDAQGGTHDSVTRFLVGAAGHGARG
jgi:VWFA-related protein